MSKKRKQQEPQPKMLRIRDRDLWARAKSDAALAELKLWEWLEDAIREKLERSTRDD